MTPFANLFAPRTRSTPLLEHPRRSSSRASRPRRRTRALALASPPCASPAPRKTFATPPPGFSAPNHRLRSRPRSSIRSRSLPWTSPTTSRAPSARSPCAASRPPRRPERRVSSVSTSRRSRISRKTSPTSTRRRWCSWRTSAGACWCTWRACAGRRRRRCERCARTRGRYSSGTGCGRTCGTSTGRSGRNREGTSTWG